MTDNRPEQREGRPFHHGESLPTQLTEETRREFFWKLFLEAAERCVPKFFETYTTAVIDRTEPHKAPFDFEFAGAMYIKSEGANTIVDQKVVDEYKSARSLSAEGLIKGWLTEWRIQLRPEVEDEVLSLFVNPIVLPPRVQTWTDVTQGWTNGICKKYIDDQNAIVGHMWSNGDVWWAEDEKQAPFRPYNPLRVTREDWLDHARKYCDLVEAAARWWGSSDTSMGSRRERHLGGDRLTAERDTAWLVRRLLLGESPDRIARVYDDELEKAGVDDDVQPKGRMVTKALRRTAKTMGVRLPPGPPTKPYPYHSLALQREEG